MEHVMSGYDIYGIIIVTLMHLQINDGFIFKPVPLSSYAVG